MKFYKNKILNRVVVENLTFKPKKKKTNNYITVRSSQ